jgi:hypothetical protein
VTDPAPDDAPPELSGALGDLLRWERAGGLWRVATRAGDRVTVTLHTCDGGSEMGRIESADPALLAFLGSRTSSEDG